MNRKKIIRRKIVMPLVCILILILITLIISGLNRGASSIYIIDSYFPVWIFLMVIISHNGIVYYIFEGNTENSTTNLYKQKFMNVSKKIIFFLLVQVLVSFISLLKIIRISRISIVLMIIFSLVVLGEIVSIRKLYNVLERILYSDMDKIEYRNINKKTSLYILLYFTIYFIFTLIVALDYYIAAVT